MGSLSSIVTTKSGWRSSKYVLSGHVLCSYPQSRGSLPAPARVLSHCTTDKSWQRFCDATPLCGVDELAQSVSRRAEESSKPDCPAKSMILWGICNLESLYRFSANWR